MRDFKVWWALDDLCGYLTVRAIDPYGARLLFAKQNPGVLMTAVVPA